jgi:hypothetical protein
MPGRLAEIKRFEDLAAKKLPGAIGRPQRRPANQRGFSDEPLIYPASIIPLRAPPDSLYRDLGLG